MGHLERDKAEAAALGVSLNTLYRRRRAKNATRLIAWSIMRGVLDAHPGRTITTRDVQKAAVRHGRDVGRSTARAWLVKAEKRGELVKVQRGVWRVR